MSSTFYIVVENSEGDVYYITSEKLTELGTGDLAAHGLDYFKAVPRAGDPNTLDAHDGTVIERGKIVAHDGDGVGATIFYNSAEQIGSDAGFGD